MLVTISIVFHVCEHSFRCLIVSSSPLCLLSLSSPPIRWILELPGILPLFVTLPLYCVALCVHTCVCVCVCVCIMSQVFQLGSFYSVVYYFHFLIMFVSHEPNYFSIAFFMAVMSSQASSRQVLCFCSFYMQIIPSMFLGLMLHG